MKVAIFFNEKKINNAELLEKIKVVLQKDCEFTNEISKSDVVIAVGGDGTIIDFAKKASNFSKPVIGVNNGNVGYLSSLGIGDIKKIKNILLNNYKIDKRDMIQAKIKQNDTFDALNDFVIARGPQSSVIEFNINSKYKFRADGLIISTATGSTAYSLSAGGPILEPNLHCVVITPICPVFHSSKSIILGLESDKIQVGYILNKEKYGNEAYFSVDGHIKGIFKESGSIDVKKSKKMAQFVRF